MSKFNILNVIYLSGEKLIFPILLDINFQNSVNFCLD